MAVRDEEVVFGLAAALAVLEVRIEDVLRIAFERGHKKRLAPFLDRARAARIAYQEKQREDLDRLAGSVHHEGICLLVRCRPWLDPDALLDMAAAGKRVAALDGVVNPHNIGAVVRTAAFLGVDGLLIGIAGDGHPLPPAAVRIAEGGAERVALAATRALPAELGSARRSGIDVVLADGEGSHDVSTFGFPRRCIVVVGHEGSGASAAVRQVASHVVRIARRGALDSLNVSVAAGIVLHAWMASSD